MLEEIAGKMAEAIEDLASELDDQNLGPLQINSVFVYAPTPPCVDIYPADPSAEDAAFGRQSRLLHWIVRARVSTAEHEGAQKLLLQLMEPADPTSVRGALLNDQTLDDTVESLDVDGPTGYQVYITPDGGTLLGCEWRVRVFNKSEPLS